MGTSPTVATYPSSRDALVNRLTKNETAYHQATGKPEALRSKLIKSEINVPTNSDEDIIFAKAVQSLPVGTKAKDLEAIRKILLECLDRSDSDTRGSSIRGAIYRAASRLDELLYMTAKS